MMKKNDYNVQQWPPRADHTVGRYNVQHASLVDPLKVYLPPLHIKLSLMKNIVVAMDRNGSGFQCLKDKFGKIKMDAKLKAGIFVGPEIREIMRDHPFR